MNIRDITNSCFHGYEKFDFFKHNVKLFFGDLNFRINMDYEEVIEKVNVMTPDHYENGFSTYEKSEETKLITDSYTNEVISELVSKDQLISAMSQYHWLYGFREMPIEFLPTYKYMPGSNIYDDSAKKRVPSYWDRILWHEVQSQEEETGYVEPILYKRIESTFSDHKPIAALFKIGLPKNYGKRVIYKFDE